MHQPNFSATKYTRWYYAIIESAQQSFHEDYTEQHHIVPRSMGGSNSKENLIRLTARQHFICHLLLVRMTSGRDRRKMVFAAHHMSICNRRERYKISSTTYERLKRQQSEMMRGKLNPMFGKTQIWTEEQRSNLSRVLQRSQAFKDCHNDTWKQNISKAQSRGVVVINSETGVVFGEWPNCSKVAEAIGCTRANIKAAVRNGTHIGLKLEALNHTRHWVKWKNDERLAPSISLTELHDISSKASDKTWIKRRCHLSPRIQGTMTDNEFRPLVVDPPAGD